jgi:hypothetical protein
MVLASATIVLIGVLIAPTFSVGATVPPAPPVDTVAPVVIDAGDSVPDEQGIITGVVETTLPINVSAATTIPAGCAIPMAPQMVFVGELLSIADTTATFRVIQVRAGTASGYINNDTVEVRYGQDTKFLDEGTRYIVGAASDPFSPLLVSKVRENAPLFGGDAVVGINGATGACPNLEDPVRTLFENGTSIDTGVLGQQVVNGAFNTDRDWRSRRWFVCACDVAPSFAPSNKGDASAKCAQKENSALIHESTFCFQKFT